MVVGTLLFYLYGEALGILKKKMLNCNLRISDMPGDDGDVAKWAQHLPSVQQTLALEHA